MSAARDFSTRLAGAGTPAARAPHAARNVRRREVRIGPFALTGDLCVPEGAHSLIIFAHGSGSSRLSPRNRAVAEALNGKGMATLLLDLLTVEEEVERANVFDIALLTRRLVDAVVWAAGEPDCQQLPIGLFGASTGAAAALGAAAVLGSQVGAVVSRGGRPDLAEAVLPRIRTPTLLIVGGHDEEVLALNRTACARLTAPKALKVVPGATHLFPEPGAMREVIGLAAAWFDKYLTPPEGND